MTPAQFRRAVLRFPEVVEGSHQGHADFRVGGRVIATMGYPTDANADRAAVEAALDAAWRRRAPKKVIAAFDAGTVSAS